jgi:pantoate--beta-alanine ligase
MQTITTVRSMQGWADATRCAGKKIGFVPTMGCLHEGHLSLVRLARDLSDYVVVSIFVNPTQFGPGEDYERYPQDLDRDRRLLREARCDVLFLPATAEMYPPGYVSYVNVEKLTHRLCGASRPGHFRGVTTVVAKLFHGVKPHLAVFGQKDAQQALVIRRMARDLDFDLEVVVGPTVREPDGLAMSSRNIYLTRAEREEAPVIYRALTRGAELVRQGERRASIVREEIRRMIEQRGIGRLDYVSIVDTDQLQELEQLHGEVLIAVAAWFGRARLIDNMQIDTGA